ncbi:MAG: hypothetical protein ACKVH8_06045 [Pirellulales bacterium]
MNKIITIIGLLALLPAAVGCTMCAHPFDYSYAAFDANQSNGHRAGSAFAPQNEEQKASSVLETVQINEIDLNQPELFFPQQTADQSSTLNR